MRRAASGRQVVLRYHPHRAATVQFPLPEQAVCYFALGGRGQPLAVRSSPRSHLVGLCSMDWPDYLRDEAAKYRQLAEQADDPVVKTELLELASVCEEVARATSKII